MLNYLSAGKAERLFQGQAVLITMHEITTILLFPHDGKAGDESEQCSNNSESGGLCGRRGNAAGLRCCSLGTHRADDPGHLLYGINNPGTGPADQI